MIIFQGVSAEEWVGQGSLSNEALNKGCEAVIS